MAVQIIERETFEDFLDDLRKRDDIRVVKLADYGFVSPLTSSTGVTVMAPQTRIVATAFDKAKNALLRWQSTRQKNPDATVAIGRARGIYGDLPVVAKKEDLQKWLELEGYSVSDGEWTSQEIERVLARV